MVGKIRTKERGKTAAGEREELIYEKGFEIVLWKELARAIIR